MAAATELGRGPAPPWACAWTFQKPENPVLIFLQKQLANHTAFSVVPIGWLKLAGAGAWALGHMALLSSGMGPASLGLSMEDRSYNYRTGRIVIGPVL